MPSTKTNCTENIVISGISGRLPECDNVDEFKQKLLQGVDMVTLDDDRRWPAGIYGLPKRSGKLKDIKHFDALFFGVHPKQAHAMDPQLRLLLEVTHEAIIDAGFNPSELRGSKTGVYVGSCLTESLDYWTRTTENPTGYSITGCNRSMFANRISYTFDFIGPSMALDTACSSSMVALQEACDAIKLGKCDSALVAGLSLNLSPNIAKHFNCLKMFSADGKCKSFDASGSGYVRSETVAAVFLQKQNQARRLYATILGAQSNTDGYKKEGITYPSGKMQYNLIKEVYSECGIDPAEVIYVETHGPGTKVGDPEELNAIVEVFCTDSRKSALMVGSVKSNMGHSEPASGICSLIKVVIAMECGVIPGNLHFNTPNPHISGLINGKLKVVSENEPWNGGLVGVNCFGFGGVNVHVVLHSNPRQKQHFTKTHIPRLITVSGRTKESIGYFMEQIKTQPYDEDLYALINKIHENNIAGHNYRGFSFLEDDRVTIENVTNEKRPIWYVFSGMGCQWPGMGRELMQFEPFKKSIQHISNILMHKGINLLEIIDSGMELTNNLRNSFISITAIQIALVDVLKILNIEPDGIIGHSIGEIACGYADGVLTHEEAILTSLARANAVLECDLPKGTMASVGITPEEFKKRNTGDLFIACYNSKYNLTISGPPDSIDDFIAILKRDGFFTKRIDVFGLAFHSRYIADAESGFRKSLLNVLRNSKRRSKRWISSSILENQWDDTLAQNASVEYFVNNLISPVYFHQACKHIQKNAIVIEIAPHAILQAILKRSLQNSVVNIGLMSKAQADVKYLLSSIGRIYNSGGQPKISCLYPFIEFPVSKDTPVISSMVKWDHSIEWSVPNFCSKAARFGELVVDIDLNKHEHNFLRGHVIDGENVIPESALIVFLWQIFGNLKNKYFRELPVIITNIKFHGKIILSSECPTQLIINIFEGSGEFEICHNNERAASGKIHTTQTVQDEFLKIDQQESGENGIQCEHPVLTLNKNDIYKELNLKGYNYDGCIRGIISSDQHFSRGIHSWDTNWILFINQMIQYSILEKDMLDLCIPSEIERICINPIYLESNKVNTITDQAATNETNLQEIPVYNYKTHDIIKSGGVELKGIKFRTTSKSMQTQLKPTLQKYEFIPLQNVDVSESVFILTVVAQLVIENNSNALTLKVVGILSKNCSEFFLTTIVKLKDIIEAEPLLHFEGIVVVKNSEVKINHDLIRIMQDYPEGNAHLVILKSALVNYNEKIITDALLLLNKNGFILFVEPKNLNNWDVIQKHQLTIVLRQETTDYIYILMKKHVFITTNSSIIEITENNYDWVESLKEAMLASEENDTKIYLFSQGLESCGLIGMVKCLLQEPGGSNIRCFLIQEENAERFSLTSSFYKDQLERDLVQNVYKNYLWGTFRHLRLDHPVKTEIEHAFVDPRSLQWIEKPVVLEGKPGFKLCSVYYVGLNLRDVMLTNGHFSEGVCCMGKVKGDYSLGIEFAGLDAKGKRVMGLVEGGALATSVLTESIFLWDVPKMWSLEEAATVPMAYITSYYALILKAGLRRNESILIHAGLTATSQAAIRIALNMGCTVFATVNNDSQKAIIRKIFPNLKRENISNYKDLKFEQIIQKETNGRGVNVVFNCLGSNEIRATQRCLSQNGILLQVGKVNYLNNYFENSKGLSVHFINTDSIYSSVSYEKQNINNWLAEGLRQGYIHPLTKTTLSGDSLEEAINLLTSKDHIGKVILEIRCPNNGKIHRNLSILSRTYMNPEKVYVIIGGLGGFGLELIKWLISRCAKKIVISTRNGVLTGYQSLCLKKWKQQDVEILISKTDSTTEGGIKSLLEESNNLGKIGGVFNLAIVLKDALMVNQSITTFEAVCKPKATIAKYLDKYTRKLAKDLDYFVMFSSVSCGRGNPGQANYGYANSTMERICEKRKTCGFPALAIQWGPIGDTGIITYSNPGIREHRGAFLQKISSCLSTLDIFLSQSNAVVSSFVLAEKTISAVEGLADAVARILGLDNYRGVSDGVTLADLGMDSLMAAEIKKVLQEKIGLALCHNKIRELTLKHLMLLEKETICDDRTE